MEQLFNAMPAGGVTEKKIETNGRITVTCRPRQVVSMAGDKKAAEGETRVEAVSMPGGDVLASFDLTKGGANDPSVTLRYRTKTGYNSLERTFQLVLNRDRNRRKVPDPIGIKVTETTSGANGAVSTAYVYSDRSYYNSLLNSDLSVLESHGPALGFWGNGRLVIRISPRAEELQPVPAATQTKPH
jgi:hypothetical protein